jgi:hypothetical protein
MRKTVLMITGLVILLGISGNLIAQETGEQVRPRERLRETLQIRQQMRKIEKEVIDNDAELQGIVKQIQGLSKQLRERLANKLVNDTEYQGLKNQLGTMSEEWKKRPKREPLVGPQ